MINYHLVCVWDHVIFGTGCNWWWGSVAGGIKYFMARRTAFSER